MNDERGQRYAAVLNIWIERFKEAQQVIRELEDENEKLKDEVAALRRRIKDLGGVWG